MLAWAYPPCSPWARLAGPSVLSVFPPSVHDLFPCLCFLEMDLKGDHIAVFGAGDGVSGLEE